MKTNKVKIEVTGAPGSGKSTIAEIVRAALAGIGFTTIGVNDDDVPPTPIAKRVAGLLTVRNTSIEIVVRNSKE